MNNEQKKELSPSVIGEEALSASSYWKDIARSFCKNKIAVVGLVLPMLRYVLFGMPPLLTAVAMSFELLTYGLVIGLLYSRSRWKCIFSLYRSLLAAMPVGSRQTLGKDNTVMEPC